MSDWIRFWVHGGGGKYTYAFLINHSVYLSGYEGFLQIFLMLISDRSWKSSFLIFISHSILIMNYLTSHILWLSENILFFCISMYFSLPLFDPKFSHLFRVPKEILLQHSSFTGTFPLWTSWICQLAMSSLIEWILSCIHL